MRHGILPVLAIVLSSAAPVHAQTSGAQDEEGFSLMEEGAKLFMRGLMEELDPAIRELEGIAREIEPAFRDLARQMGPALAEILATIDNIRFYEAPVILENGDILIRRSDDAPPYAPPEDTSPEEPGDEIEL